MNGNDVLKRCTVQNVSKHSIIRKARRCFDCREGDFADRIRIGEAKYRAHLIVIDALLNAHNVTVEGGALSAKKNKSTSNRNISHPIKSKSQKINVFSESNPSAMISLAFSIASRFASSTDKSFHRHFSSSVICMTSGASNTSCIHLEDKQ